MSNAGETAVGCVVGLALILALPIGYFIYRGYAPQLLVNPVTRYMYPLRDAAHGDRLQLIPELFAVGDAKQDVVSRLRGAGFESWHNYRQQFDADSQVTDIFHIWAGGNIACGYEFFVELQFDNAQTLTGAEAVRDGACL